MTLLGLQAWSNCIKSHSDMLALRQEKQSVVVSSYILTK